LIEKERISYSVGQPMGAYSSFAMLALTHHVIVHIAARMVHVDPKNLIYMVLGDDGAMANSKVAKSYVALFLSLGMKINPIKGFDGTVLEFAKQLLTISGINVSPIGPKNIMLALRHVEFLPSVLFELFVKRFPLFLNRKLKSNLPSEVDIKRSIQLAEMYLAAKRSYIQRFVDEFIVGKKFDPVPVYMGVDLSSSYTKRTESGVSVRWDKMSFHQTCLISALSLFQLVSRVHFQSGKKGKVIKFNLLTEQEKKEKIDITTKIKLRVLMAIGPVSGLWFVQPKITRPYFGKGIFWLYRDMFIRGIYT